MKPQRPLNYPQIACRREQLVPERWRLCRRPARSTSQFKSDAEGAALVGYGSEGMIPGQMVQTSFPPTRIFPASLGGGSRILERLGWPGRQLPLKEALRRHPTQRERFFPIRRSTEESRRSVSYISMSAAHRNAPPPLELVASANPFFSSTAPGTTA